MLVDQAMAWAQWGKPSQSYRTVLAAERMAAGEVRTRNTARRLVAELLNAKNQSAMRGLPQLAARIHSPGDDVRTIRAAVIHGASPVASRAGCTDVVSLVNGTIQAGRSPDGD